MAYPFPYSLAAKLDSRINIPRPMYDPVLAPMLDSAPMPEEFDLDLMRGVASGDQECSHGSFIFNATTILQDKPHLSHTEHTVTGPDNNPIILSVFTPKEPAAAPRPALYHIHGGGMVSGDRFTALTPVIDLLEGIDCVVVSVEHRRAPETRAPGPAEDCYAGLVWVSEHAASLGIDPAAMVVFGVSGGGALAAATCLMARDRKSPTIPIKAQMLYSPLLDDRLQSLSDRQFEYGNPASTAWIRRIWQLVLGDAYGSDKVTPYQAPGRATDLANLPPAYIDAGECEVFRDSSVAYATSLWRCGSTCELHIWPGAFHGFDMLDDPNVPLVHMANQAKRNWFKRAFKA
ncbi:alpha/beta hydrolase fold-3 domain-containing protein [Cladophialophora carrionii]|uniref:Alpha/beta hydrolase fold-3 domain-containing protein n=1 Tax=Cladophialophora carrionii TaxID=86049 RepID=A0A1C1CGG6_9EURO|nr:alpha/beta hydrolase fold-3 domain-containing protein [Cladophialophora carrionii]